jgi:hypothetical protein
MSELDPIEPDEIQQSFKPKALPVTKEVQIPMESPDKSFTLRYVPQLHAQELLDYYQISEASVPESLNAAIGNIIEFTADLTTSSDSGLTDNLYFISQVRRTSEEFGLGDQLATLPQFIKHVAHLYPKLEPRLLDKVVKLPSHNMDRSMTASLR